MVSKLSKLEIINKFLIKVEFFKNMKIENLRKWRNVFRIK